MTQAFQIRETEDGIEITAFGEMKLIRPQQIKALKWGEASRVRQVTQECAVRYASGSKIHNALAIFRCEDGGAWSLIALSCKNGGRVFPVGWWDTFTADPENQRLISGHSAEKLRNHAPQGRIYYTFIGTAGEEYTRIFGTYIASDWATYRERAERHRKAHPQLTLTFRWWQKQAS